MTLVKYAKQRKPATCPKCKATGFDWYEDTDVTDQRSKRWYLYDTNGNVHEHEPQAATRTKFTFLVAYTITAKDREDAATRIGKWGDALILDGDDARRALADVANERQFQADEAQDEEPEEDEEVA